MNIKKSLEYLQAIYSGCLTKKNIFMHEFQNQLSNPSNSHIWTATQTQQQIELKTKIYEILSYDSMDIDFHTFVGNFGGVIGTKAKLFRELCQHYSTLEIDIISLLINKINRAIQEHHVVVEDILVLVGSFDGEGGLLDSKVIYHVYLGLVYLWVSLLVEGDFLYLRTQLPTLFHKLSLLQQKFTKQLNQFEIITYIFRVASLALGLECRKNSGIFQKIVNSQISSYQQIATVQSAINKGEGDDSQYLITNKQGYGMSQAVYYKTMERYILLDPNFRVALIKNIKQLTIQKANEPVIQKHINVVTSILNKHIFPNYPLQILKQISSTLTLQTNLSNPLIQILQKLLIIVSQKCLNRKDFLLANKRQLFCMGVNQQLKKTVFMIYYDFISKEEGVDGEIFDFLVLWNIRLCLYVPEFVQLIRRRGFQVVSESTFAAVSDSNTQFARQLFKTKLQTLNKKDMSSTYLFSPQYLKKNEKSYIFCSQILLKFLTAPHTSQPLQSITLSQNSQTVTIAYEKYLFLLENASKNNIRNLQFTQKIYLIGSLLENQRIVGIEGIGVERYYVRMCDLGREELMGFIEAMFSYYRVTATKFSLYGILVGLLFYQIKGRRESRDHQYQQYIYQKLQRLFNQHQKTLQHKIIGFSEQSLKLLIIIWQFWINNSQKINKICIDILASWSPLFTRATAQLILYQFDSQLFGEYLEYFNISLPILAYDRKIVINSTLKILLGIFEAPYCNPTTYISPYKNQIEFMPIQTSSQRNSLQLKFNISLNPLKHSNSSIDFYSSPRNQKKSPTLTKHRIYFNNNRLIFQHRNKKEILCCSDGLPKSRSIAIRVKIAESRFKIYVDSGALCSINYQYLVENIRFQINGELFVKDIEWTRFENQSRIVDPMCRYCVYPGQLEIRMKRTSLIRLQQFTKILPRSYLIGYLNNLFSNNMMSLSMGEFYNTCFLLILQTYPEKGNKNKKEGESNFDNNFNNNFDNNFDNNQDDVEDRKLIYYFFRNLRYQMHDRKTYLPQFASIPSKIKTRQIYFDTLCAAYYNSQYLNLCPNKLKHQILDYISQTLTTQQPFQNFQNQNMVFFIHSFKICDNPACQSLIAIKILPMIHFILMKHRPNSILLEKIRYFFFVCKSLCCESQVIREFFGDFMGNFLEEFVKLDKRDSAIKRRDSGNSCKSQQYQNNAKYVIINLQQFDLIFQSLPLETKHLLLDYFLTHQQYLNKILSIAELISDSEFLSLEDWIICNTKRILFEYFQYKQKKDKKLQILQFLLDCIIKLILKKELNFQEEIKIITQFAKMASNANNNDGGNDNGMEIQVIGEYFCKDGILYLLVDAFEKVQLGLSANIQILWGMVTACFDFIFGCQKEQLLKFLILFRQKTSAKPQIYKYIFKLQKILTLPIYALSCFLQFTYQVLIVLEYTLPDDPLLEEISIEIEHYIQCLIKNYSQITKQLKNPLLYCYPKLQKATNYDNIQEHLGELKKMKVKELSGGVYFKLICIVLKIIEINPDRDCSFLLEYVLEKIIQGEKKQSSKTALYRAVSDFSQMSKDVKLRSTIQCTITQNSTSYEDYLNQKDPKKTTYSLSLNHQVNRKSNKDSDLTPFFVEYCLMRICNFLQIMGDIDDTHVSKIMRNYTSIFLRNLMSSQFVLEQLNEKNVDFGVSYENVQELLKLTVNKEQQTISDIVSSPISRKQSQKEEEPNFDFNTIEKFITPPSMKRKRAFSIDIGSSKKKKIQMLHEVEKDVKKWGLQPKNKKLHRYFANQTKIIWLQDLLHSFFTIMSADEQSHKFETLDNKKLVKFLQNYSINQFSDISVSDNKRYSKLLNKIEIRKIFPYTIDEHPVKKLKSVCFDNMTNPLIKYSKIGKYKTTTTSPNKTQILSRESLLFKEEQSLLQSIFGNNTSTQIQISLDIEHKNAQLYMMEQNQEICILEQKNNFQNICELSVRKGIYFCQYKFDQNCIIMTTKQEKYAPSQRLQRVIKFGAPLSAILPIQGKKIYINIQNIYKIFYRKFNQIRNNAIQIFFNDGSSVLVILYTEILVNGFLEKCRQRFREFAKIKVVKDYIKQFNERGYTEKWSNGELSNFDYLMLVNKYSGRSLVDLNQYYIFPWILKDYTSKHLNLQDSEIYRDLKKPIGALNQSKLKKYLQKYKSQSTQGQKKYLYGSHYSTSLFVLYYLVRIQPFTSLHLEMQSGSFDSPDRIFSSINQMWECLLCETSVTDIKEAIPQFYYMPAFLSNTNNLDMGVKMNESKVGDVELPPWASSSTNFIHIMRACLQSDYVSLNLHHWIDLIFGKDQHSLQKHNIFHPLSYCQNIKPSAIATNNLDAIMTQIFYFGQNPNILFPKQHPKKKLKLNTDLLKSSTMKTIKKNRTQQKLEKNVYIKNVKVRRNNVFIVAYEINRKGEAFRIDLNMESSIQGIENSLQERKNCRMSKLQSLQDIQYCFQSYRNIELRVDQSEIGVYMKSTKDTVLMKKIKILYNFKHAVSNQSVLIVYGSYGLRIYNWTLTLLHQITPPKGQIVDIYLQPTYFFYLTSTGILHLFDFCTQKSQQLCYINDHKHTKHAEMYVFPEKKLPTKKNQFGYKFVLIGDLRHIVVFVYWHVPNCNGNSNGNGNSK